MTSAGWITALLNLLSSVTSPSALHFGVLTVLAVQAKFILPELGKFVEACGRTYVMCRNARAVAEEPATPTLKIVEIVEEAPAPPPGAESGGILPAGPSPL